MSKYNNMKSIPIDSLTSDELKVAIKEWAEGDNSMERLLWTCKFKNVETMGCHAGGRPYIDICVNNSKEDIIRLINITFNKEKSQILIKPDGGNPFSGDKWFVPSITLNIETKYKDEADKYFDSLSDALLSKEKENILDFELFSKIIDLHDFFIGKESCLMFRIKHELDNYIFYVEVIKREKNFDYFNNLFVNAGLVLDEDCTVKEINVWKIENSNKIEFSSALKKVIKYITDNYSLPLPIKESEVTSFTALALFKKREYGDTAEGIKKFNEWLEIKRN